MSTPTPGPSVGPMLRIVGTREECERVVELLRASVARLAVSPFYKDRGGVPGNVRVIATVMAWPSTPRSVTVPTVDHGDVTVPEPAWCTGHSPVPEERADLTHYGPEQQLHFRGQLLWTGMLAHAPFSGSPLVGVYVEQTGFAATLDPAGLRELAATQAVHAEQLRRLARELEALQDGGDR